MPKSAIPAAKLPKPVPANARPKIERAALKTFHPRGCRCHTHARSPNRQVSLRAPSYRHYKGKDELALALFMKRTTALADDDGKRSRGEGSLEEEGRCSGGGLLPALRTRLPPFFLHLVSFERYLPYDKRRDDDRGDHHERIIGGTLMRNGIIPSGDPP